MVYRSARLKVGTSCFMICPIIRQPYTTLHIQHRALFDSKIEKFFNDIKMLLNMHEKLLYIYCIAYKMSSWHLQRGRYLLPTIEQANECGDLMLQNTETMEIGQLRKRSTIKQGNEITCQNFPLGHIVN